MKNFVTSNGIIAGVFTPAFVVVTKDTAKTLDFKKEDVFLNFEDARAEAMRRGSSLVIEVKRRDKNGL